MKRKFLYVFFTKDNPVLSVVGIKMNCSDYTFIKKLCKGAATMSAILEANKPYEIEAILKNFRERHAWVKVRRRYQENDKFYVEAEFCD